MTIVFPWSASRRYSGRASITLEPNHRSVSRNPIRDGGWKSVTTQRNVPILVASKYDVPLPRGPSEVWPHRRNKPVRCIQVPARQVGNPVEHGLHGPVDR